MTIYDKTDTFHWSTEITDRDNYKEGDVFVSLDPQERLGEGTITVTKYKAGDPHENLWQRGIFWHKEHAEIFAEQLHNELNGDTDPEDPTR